MKPEKKTYYDGYGGVMSEVWRLDGRYHREDGPAFISYFKDGSVCVAEWRRNDKLHRTDGPAYVFYREDGRLGRAEWWIEGVKLEDL